VIFFFHLSMGFTCSDIAELQLKLALNANQSMGFVLFNLLISFWCSVLLISFWCSVLLISFWCSVLLISFWCSVLLISFWCSVLLISFWCSVLLISFWCSVLSTIFNLLSLFYWAFYVCLLNYGFWLPIWYHQTFLFIKPPHGVLDLYLK
jgi:hypothetical protein